MDKPIRTNLGAVTAYADAVKHGYTGTREEFGQLIANFGDSAKQVADDAAEVRQNKENIEGIETNVENLQSQAAQSAQEAEESKTQASGYASASEASRNAAAESETNVNAQVTGFDERVAEKTASAETDIENARIAANKAVVAQQEESVQEVKNKTSQYITEKQSEAEQTIANKQSEAVEAVNTAGATQTDAVNTAGAAQKKAVEDAGQEALNNIGTGVDSTLSTEGKAADAAATGKAIDELKGELGIVKDNVLGYETPTPAQFYKIVFYEVWDSNKNKPSLSASLAELKLLDENDNDCVISSIIADSEYGSEYLASNLIDGNLTTIWSSKNDGTVNHELIITLNNPTTVTKLGMMLRLDYMGAGLVNNFSVYASTDKLNWMEIGKFVDQKNNWNYKVWNYYELSEYKRTMPTIREEINNLHNITINTNTMIQNERYINTMNEWQSLGMGLFIHWGVYSCLAGKYYGIDENGENIQYNGSYNTEWIQLRAKIPSEYYKEYGKKFTGKNWNADEIARLAYQAGMKYVIITTKHHEGFSLFPTEYGTWDITQTPCRNTVIDELAEACKKYGLKFGAYFSQNYDWNEIGGFGRENHMYMGVDPYTDEQHMEYLSKTIGEIREIVDKYDPFVIWYDMGNSNKKYIDILLEAQEQYWPDIIVNDRISSTRGFYGDFVTGEDMTATTLKPYVESCFNLNGTWGYSDKNDDDYFYNEKNPEIIFKDFILDSLCQGQNCLLNIGPMADGSIPNMQINRLKFISEFFKKYGTFDGYKRVSYNSSPEYGHMIELPNNTIRCFIYEPDNQTTVLDGFDTTYIKSVRVFDAENEYSSDNYEVVSKNAIKILNPLNTLKWSENVNGNDVVSDAKVGVVEISFSQKPLVIDAIDANSSTELSARVFTIICNANGKKNRTKELSIYNGGVISTDFIWEDESGLYGLSKFVTINDGENCSGILEVKNLSDGTVYSKNYSDLSSTDKLYGVYFENNTKYRITLSITQSDSTVAFDKICFEKDDISEVSYTNIDYIESSGKQYITIPYTPTKNTKMEVEFQSNMVVESNIRRFVVGCESPTFFIATKTNELGFGFGDGSQKYYSYPNGALDRYNVILDKGKIYINGVEKDTINYISGGTSGQLTLFARYGTQNIYTYRFVGKIYMAKIWDNDELIYDFIPVIRDYDKKCGMLDKVNDVFYESDSSCEFYGNTDV